MAFTLRGQKNIWVLFRDSNIGVCLSILLGLCMQDIFFFLRVCACRISMHGSHGKLSGRDGGNPAISINAHVKHKGRWCS
jgi:hypothetical protein